MPANPTTTTIASHHARRVLTFALWRIAAADVVGEHELGDGLYDRAWREINPLYMLDQTQPARAEFALMRLAALGAAARTVDAARLGEAVELPASAAELASALHDCVAAIDQNHCLFVDLSPDGREDVLRCRRAAITLLAALEAAQSCSAVSVPEFPGPLRVSRADTPSAVPLPS